ncbi:Hypothetical protein SMAX5B_015996 [Scophthalmus maximus]|uniref:Uncharacterized protein n=1 Tax=Scophthalmus maximus TaxID=52904 RepID=A0A2U9CS26_SCOMX|nr:Hypothetical protein SMAX5B_015996 [Scophthalmus maximus]
MWRGAPLQRISPEGFQRSGPGPGKYGGRAGARVFVTSFTFDKMGLRLTSVSLSHILSESATAAQKTVFKMPTDRTVVQFDHLFWSEPNFGPFGSDQTEKSDGPDQVGVKASSVGFAFGEEAQHDFSAALDLNNAGRYDPWT